MHPSPLSAREQVLAVLALLLVACACLAPPIAQASGYHAFADTHTRWGLPHAGNLLSNLPFAVVGVALLLLRTRSGSVEMALVRLTGAGLVLTALGSTWYHAAPGDSGLTVDRLAMCSAFAGLLGLAGCRAGARAGVALAVLALTGELGDHAVWVASGEWLSGHSLKHVVAALSLLPVLAAVRARQAAGQNAPQLRTTSA